jgi:hypothetical protein
MASQGKHLRERVTVAAEAVLKHQRSVGPLELLQEMSLLAPSHFVAWQKGVTESLTGMIQGSPQKLRETFALFEQWARDRRLLPITGPYTRPTPAGAVALHVTREADPEQERFFSTRYVPGDASARETERITRKLSKPDNLVVFQTVSDSVICAECRTEMPKNEFLFMEKNKPLCLACADLDHLEYLPRGDATLTRRAHKNSPLSAVVVRFARTRNRYERQGILVTPEAIEKAEKECAADKDKRTARRPMYALRREKEDRQLHEAMTGAIREMYPDCPVQEAERIALHAARRGSGRVGRSAAGRRLDPEALQLAVKAWVRHNHTDYDRLLMEGADRAAARSGVSEKIRNILDRWSSAR